MGNLPHQHCAVAEVLQQEADLLEGRKPPERRIIFLAGEGHRHRRQQDLPLAQAGFPAQAVIENALVCRMLVNQHKGVLVLHHNIGAEQLPQKR